MTDRTGPITFNYSFGVRLLVYLVWPVLFVVVLGLGIFAFKVARSVPAGIFLTFSGVVLLTGNILASFMLSSIVISDDGIAVTKFGQTLRFIAWEGVSRVRKRRMWNAGAMRFQDSFDIDDGVKAQGLFRRAMINLYGAIHFNDRICRLRSLLDEINVASQEYGFPLVVTDQEAATGGDKRLIYTLKVEEVRLAKF